MAKKKYDSSEGIWRTIGGRRVFIRTGQSLSDAMKESGKFKTKITEQEKGKLSDIQKQEGIRLNQKAENGVRDDVKSFLSGKENYDGSREDFINDLSNEWGVDKNKVESILNEERTKHPRNFKTDRPNRPIHQLGQLNETDEEINLDTYKYISEKEPKDELKEISGGAISTLQTTTPKSKADRLKPGTEIYYTGDQANIPGYFTVEKFEPEKEQYLASVTLKEKGGEGRTFKIGSQSIASEYGKDPGARFSFKEDYDNYRNKIFEGYRKQAEERKTKETNWREQIKKNNEQMEKELEDYKKNHDISRESDDYYEIFRNNERRNAKIKQEVPTEPYEYVEAYAGYHDKSYKLAGTKMSGKDVVEYGRKSWTGKEYTNDEFMEHLTDSNWHQERKMLEEAKLTNEELSYIKDHTTLSQWSVGEELTGSKNTQKMIDEAKDYSKYAKKIREKQNTPYYKQQMDKAVSDLQLSTLENKYKGTVDYLKQTTNMSGAEILELLKKIDEDKK